MVERIGQRDILPGLESQSPESTHFGFEEEIANIVSSSESKTHKIVHLDQMKLAKRFTFMAALSGIGFDTEKLGLLEDDEESKE